MSSIYTMTPALWQGPFASRERLPELQAAGVTHILNVCETTCELSPGDGPFVEITQHPFADNRVLPLGPALATLDALHRMVCVPGSVVYVHCVAGWMRSPTFLWLYLFACGSEGIAAARAIRHRNPRAEPGYAELIDGPLLNAIHAHGQQHYLPHPRPESLAFI